MTRRRVLLAILACVLALPFLAAIGIWLWVMEQNRAGREEWNSALAKVPGAGEPTNYEAMIPPAIPAADNLAAIDFFKLEREPGTNELRMLKLRASLDKFFGKNSPQSFGNFTKGEIVDRGKLQKFIADRYRAVFQKDPPGSTLAQINELCPELATVREASANRHDCRFERDYLTQPPYGRPLGDITTMLRFAKILNYDGVAALEENRPDIAFQDLETSLTLVSGYRKEPLLISGLMGIGTFAIGEQILWQGIASGAWNDAQLAQLQEQLGHIDFLSNSQLCLRGEALGYTLPTLDYLQLNQKSTGELFTGLVNQSDTNNSGMLLLWKISPAGWFDSARAKSLTIIFDAARAVDPAAHRVHPEVMEKVPDFRKTFSGYRPPVMLAGISLGPITNGSEKFAEGQFRTDAALIAVMIERYRLTHGALPSSLDDLTAFGPVPHDLFTGETYHYSVRPDKTYLLYSVGWDQVDDHGEVIYTKQKSDLADFKKGDWVWPQPGHPGS